MTLRPIDPADAGIPFSPEWQEALWCMGVFEDGRLNGHALISRSFGNVWLTHLAYWGGSPTAVPRLFQAARKFLKSQGITEVCTDVANPKVVDLFYKLGFTVERVLMKGKVI